MALSRLFALLIELSGGAHHIILWFKLEASSHRFWRLDQTFSSSQNRLPYAPPTLLGSTLDFGFSYGARDRFRILLGMGILVFCAALLVHYRVFP